MRLLNENELDYLRAEVIRLQSGQDTAPDTSQVESLQATLTAKNQQINDLRAENDELKRQLQAQRPE